MQFWTSLIVFTTIVTSVFHTATVSAIPYRNTRPDNPNRLARLSTGTGNFPSLHVSHQIKRGPGGGILKPPSEDFVSILQNLSHKEREDLFSNIAADIRDGIVQAPSGADAEVKAAWQFVRAEGLVPKPFKVNFV
ncbi:hypothetical protein BC835DRAFT_1346215, partial [Cytidiella melzeri]